MAFIVTVKLDGTQTEADAIHGQALLDALLERMTHLCESKAIHVPGWDFTTLEVTCDYDQPLEKPPNAS